MGWVERHLHAFDPFHGGRPYRATSGQRSSELGVALYVHNILRPAESERLAPFVDFLDELRSRPEVAHRVVRNPAEFVLGADLYGLLRCLGRDDPAHRALVQRAVDAGFLDHVERHPHRELDVRLALEWSGVEHDWPSVRDIVRRSPLVKGALSPLLLDEGALYALTHVVLFATDFGLAEGRLCDDDTLRPIAEVLPILTVVACADRHWDLLGELLICHQALGLPRDRTWREGWEVFLGRQRPDGAFPGPDAALEGSGDRGSWTPGELAEADIAHHYHTTLIGWIALALRLDGESRAPRVAIGDEGEAPPRDPAERAPDRPAPDLAEVAARSRRWLLAVLAELHRGPSSPGEACSVIVGLELCDRLDPDFPDHTQVLATAARRIGMASAGGAEAGPASRLAAAAVLMRNGIIPPPYLDLLAHLAGVLVKDPATQDPEVVHQAEALLTPLGLVDEVDEAAEPRLAAILDRPILALDREGLMGLLHDIEEVAATERITAEGRRRSGGRFDEVAPVLGGQAVAAFRHMDVELGCRIVRALFTLDPSRDPRRWVDHLLFHARPDGAFGFFGPESRSLLDSPPPAGPGGRGPDPQARVRQLELTSTVACLRALVEIQWPGQSFLETLLA